MHPVAAVLFGRAEARRTALLGLAVSIPEAMWQRRAGDSQWTAREHLAHALSSDAVVVRVLERFDDAAFAELAERREDALQRALARSFDDMLDVARKERNALRLLVERLPPDWFERTVVLHGPRSDVPVTMMAYLAAWAGHDAEHEFAIRRAVAVHPDLSAVAHARRWR